MMYFLAALRRRYDAGEHEALIEALDIVYVAEQPLPEWLYKALSARLERTQTRQERRDRRQRVVDEWRHELVTAARAQGMSAPDAIADASVLSEGTIAEGGDDAIVKSYKKTRARRERAGLKFELAKSGQTEPKNRK